MNMRDRLNINKSKNRTQSSVSGWTTRNLLYIYFLIFLAMIYIANTHYTEKKILKIDQLKKEIQELNWTHITHKSDVLYNATYTQLGDKVKSLQLSSEGDFPEKLSKRKMTRRRP
jgi:hypothetical protein